MKRWFALVAFLSLLLIAFAGCASSDDSSGGSGGDSGASGDAASDGSTGFGKDGGGKDATTSDDGGVSDSGVVDSGEDSAVDSGFDAGFDAGVDSGPPFVVTVAASTNDVTATVTFSDPPNATEANDKTHYAISGGLTVSAAVLSGNTVTLTTSVQSATSYTVTVTGVTRSADGAALSANTANFTGIGAFDVSSAAAANSTTVNVQFDAPPDMTSANDKTHYSIPGLTVSAASLSGSIVTLTTSTQTATSFTLTVTGVTRASDGEALATNAATFTGHPTFNVASAVANSATKVTVTFDAAPNTTTGSDKTNFTIAGLNVTAATPSGNTVVLTTDVQSATSFTVDVANVTRASDDEPLTTKSAIFTGVAPFDVTSGIATSLTTVDVAFDGPVDTTTGAVATNYSIPGLTISGAVVSGTSLVTLTTSMQSSLSYTVTVSNVVRTGDNAGLSGNTATFAQAGPGLASVSSVVVTSTSPDNGTIPYNTGTSTVTITGTDFIGIACLTAVKLDDLDGIGGTVGTKPTACSVDSGTQITATFPAGIRTNGSTGWDVIITNPQGTNTSSVGKFIPKAGLLISEVLIATTADANQEFVEIYNPTGTSIDTQAFNATTHPNGVGLKLHQVASTGTDNAKPLTIVNGSSGLIASHGFLLLASTAALTAATPPSWASHADYSYTAAFGANNGAYVTIGGTATPAQSKVIDKVGWGSSAAAGFNTGAFEGTAISPTIDKDDSVQRKPGSPNGATTDSDVNSADFLGESGTITPKGSGDGHEP